MVFRELKVVLILLALVAPPFGAVAHAESFPSVDGATVEWVSKSMVVNGMTGAFRTFDTDKSVEKVLEFYRNLWSDGYEGKPGYREGWLGNWKIISRLDDGKILMVQVMGAGSGSTGYLSESDLASRDKGELEQIVYWFDMSIPGEFWSTLKAKGLMEEAAPVPLC